MPEAQDIAIKVSIVVGALRELDDLIWDLIEGDGFEFDEGTATNLAGANADLANAIQFFTYMTERGT